MKYKLIFAILVSALMFTVGANAATAPQQIQVVNASTLVSDADIQAALPAFQQSIDLDVGPIWGVSANLTFLPTGQTPDPNAWTIYVVNDTGLGGAAGFHSWTKNTGPVAYIGTDTDINWQLVFSHELDEMLVDPYINRVNGVLKCNVWTCKTRRFYLTEIGDPVELASYQINGVMISDFITPKWGLGFKTGIDFLGLLPHKRHSLLSGGYVTYYSNGHWAQMFDIKKRVYFRRLRSRPTRDIFSVRPHL